MSDEKCAPLAEQHTILPDSFGAQTAESSEACSASTFSMRLRKQLIYSNLIHKSMHKLN